MAAGSWFLVGYSVALLGLASGLHLLGRKPIAAWSAHSAVAARPDDGPDRPQAGSDWAEVESGRLHTVIGLVAAAAAVVLPLAGLCVFRTTVERAVLTTTALVAVLTGSVIVRSVARHRVAGRDGRSARLS